MATSCHTSKITTTSGHSKDFSAATALIDSLLIKSYINNDYSNPKIHKIFNLDNTDNTALYAEVTKWLGTPYKYGGQSFKGTDCSGMVKQIYKNVYNIQLQRNSAMMLEKNCKPIPLKELSEGDLLFFSAKGKNGKVNHVGIYLKKGTFVHASSSRGVIVSALDDTYYLKRFVTAGRVKDRY